MVSLLLQLRINNYLFPLTNFCNPHCGFLPAQSATSYSSISTKQDEAKVFAELVMHVGSALVQDTYVLKLAALHTACGDRLMK